MRYLRVRPKVMNVASFSESPFTMSPHAQDDAFIGPFHGRSLQEFGSRRSKCDQALNQVFASPVKAR